jgi:hypothetical protein
MNKIETKTAKLYKTRKRLDTIVKSGLEEIGIKLLFFQKIGLTSPLDAEGLGSYIAGIDDEDEKPETYTRGYPRLGYTVIHDNVARRWERRPVSIFTDLDGNSLPDEAVSILKRFQVACWPIWWASIAVWTPDRRTHSVGEVPDPMLVLEIGGSCYALCRWNG